MNHHAAFIKGLFLVFIYAALACLLTACQPDDECDPAPLPYVPADAPSELSEDLNWLLDLNQYTRERPRAVFAKDTFLRIETIARTLANVSFADGQIFRAIAQRIAADQDLLRGQSEAARSKLTVSLGELEKAPAESAAYYYELVNQHNSLATALEQLFLPEEAIVHARSAVEISAARGFLLSEVQDRHQLSLAYGYLQREDLQRRELEKAVALEEVHGACFAERDAFILPVIRMSLVRNIALSARRAAYIGDDATAKRLAREARALVPAAEQLIRIADPDGAHRMINGLLQSQIQLGLDLVPDPETLSITEKAIERQRELLAGSYSANVTLMSEALLEAKYHQRCDSPNYQTALDAMAAHDPKTGDPAYLRVRNLIGKRVAAYECLCAEIQGNESLMRTARKRAVQMTKDYESFLTRRNGGLISEALAGNWEGFYTDAIDIVTRADRFLEPAPAFFSNSALLLSDHAKSSTLGASLRQISTTAGLSSEYSRKRERLQALINLRNEAINSPVADGLAEKQRALSTYLDGLHRSDKAADQRLLRDFSQFPDVSLAEIRAALPGAKSAAIDLFHGKGYLLVSAITKDKERQFHLPVTPALLRALEATRVSPASGDLLAAEAFTIYETALKPVIEWVSGEGIDDLLIVRDKTFAQLAFGYLPMERPETDAWSRTKLLIDDFSISYFYSLSSLVSARAIRRGRSAPRGHWASFLATESIKTPTKMTEPLPKLGEMVRETTATYHDRDTVFQDCRPAVLLDVMSGYKYLTLAAHGFAKAETPGTYYLQFEPTGGGSNGTVELTDIYPRMLTADLTLLLNCGSAKGSAFDAEGRKSFARAFLYAGSSAVIAGNDFLLDPHVAEIGRSFHRYWIEEKMSSSAALRRAKLDFRKANQQLSPRDWGSLLHYGLPDVYYQP